MKLQQKIKRSVLTFIIIINNTIAVYSIIILQLNRLNQIIKMYVRMCKLDKIAGKKINKPVAIYVKQRGREEN